MADKAKKAYKGAVPIGEQISYYIGGLGQGMMYGIMSSFILDFYMNVAKLNAVFVLLLMLLARVWDAINDPLMGMIMDRSQPKWGKMRTYLFFLPLPIAIFTTLLFWVPDLSGTMMMVYACVTYVVWGMIYTVADIPFWALPNAMTPHEDERGRVTSIARITNGIGSAVPSVMIVILSWVLGRLYSDPAQVETTKFMVTAAVCGLLGFVCYFQTPFKVKERVPLPKKQQGGKEAGKPHPLKLVFGCKPLMLTALMGILSGGRYMYQAAAPHVARYAFFHGNIDSLMGMNQADKVQAVQSSYGTVYAIMQAAVAGGMFISMMIAPLLYKKFNYKQLLIGSCLVGGLSSLITFFIGYDHFYAIIPFLLLSSIPVGVINVVAYPMVGDSLDYMEWKTGYRENGLGLSCQSFVIKLANALATSAIAVVYMILNLDIGGMNDNAGANLASVPMDQVATVRGSMFSLISLVPAISLLLCIIPILFYDLTGKKKEQITTELAERRAAEAGLEV